MGAYETQGFKLNDTGRRIVVDPVTRIEGHMRCEVNLDKNNVITTINPSFNLIKANNSCTS
jgi:hydrogenase large subunit